MIQTCFDHCLAAVAWVRFAILVQIELEIVGDFDRTHHHEFGMDFSYHHLVFHERRTPIGFVLVVHIQCLVALEQDKLCILSCVRHCDDRSDISNLAGLSRYQKLLAAVVADVVGSDQFQSHPTVSLLSGPPPRLHHLVVKLLLLQPDVVVARQSCRCGHI